MAEHRIHTHRVAFALVQDDLKIRGEITSNYESLLDILETFCPGFPQGSSCISLQNTDFLSKYFTPVFFFVQDLFLSNAFTSKSLGMHCNKSLTLI